MSAARPGSGDRVVAASASPRRISVVPTSIVDVAQVAEKVTRPGVALELPP